MKSVVFLTCTKLPCIGTNQAPVILCLSDEVELVSELNTLPGFLLTSTEINDDCSSDCYWRYTISYDENLLVDPEYLIVPDDIESLFCETCFTNWIKNLITTTTLCVSDSDTIDFQIDEDGCVTGEVKISADEGNIIEAHGDGIFAEASGGGDDWHLTGNAGTVPGTNYTGTSDNVAHDIRANNVISRRTAPNSTCPNIYNGKWTSFSIGGDQVGYTIGGGAGHIIEDGYFTTIGGGFENLLIPDAVQPDGGYSYIGGGWNNIVQIDDRPWADPVTGEQQGMYTIGGGFDNLLINAGDFTTIAGGFVNQIQYSPNDPYYDADEYIYGDAICGGISNQILGNGNGSTGTVPRYLGGNFIGGGDTNEIDQGYASVISGGAGNIIIRSPIGVIDTDPRDAWNFNFIGSGVDNAIAHSNRCVIGGGGWNQTQYVDICGIFSGFLNIITNTIPVTPFEQSATFTPGFEPDDPPDEIGIGNVIAGGIANWIENGKCSAILGGAFLKIGAYSAGIQNAKTRDFTNIDGLPRDYTNPTEPAQVDVSAEEDVYFLGDFDLWIGNTDGVARKVKFWEPNTDLDFSSAFYSSFQAPAQAANIEYILPATPGIAGDSLKIQSVVGDIVTLEWAA